MEHIQLFKNKLNRQVGQNENITFDFFIAFSRMEFALKHTGYAIGDRRRNAMADWDRFGEDNNEVFQEKLKNPENKLLIEAANYLFVSPPKKLKFRNNELSWENRPPIGNKSLKEMLLIIRAIRNNLFHGSKRLAIVEESRNRDLLNFGLIILNECLNIDQNVRQKFLDDLG